MFLNNIVCHSLLKLVNLAEHPTNTITTNITNNKEYYLKLNAVTKWYIKQPQDNQPSNNPKNILCYCF